MRRHFVKSAFAFYSLFGYILVKHSLFKKKNPYKKSHGKTRKYYFVWSKLNDKNSDFQNLIGFLSEDISSTSGTSQMTLRRTNKYKHFFKYLNTFIRNNLVKWRQPLN